jgi:hypothetical protein
MINIKLQIWTAFVLLFTISCNNNSEKNKGQAEQITITAMDVTGDFVDDNYQKRNEGYDWVAVSVKATSDSTLHISIRSRADKKKPTCTFDADAKKTNESTYNAVTEGKNIVFSFTDSTITINTESEADKGILNYFCSGGGSLEGTYKKIKEPLDEKQIDQTVFSKTLFLQNIGFDIKTTGKGSTQQLTIQPFGLKIDNSKISMEVDGSVTGAEIEDLNADGFPEVLIYTVSAGSGSYGNVIGYSVNNGKSISQIYFPPLTENKEASKGYMGHDEFAIVENSLVQRFKTYNTGDANSTPTGNIRQIQYKLKDGEASRKFVAVNTTEFSVK